MNARTIPEGSAAKAVAREGSVAKAVASEGGVGKAAGVPEGGEGAWQRGEGAVARPWAER